MVAINDITGDKIKTGGNSKKFNDNWDKIFLKKDVKKDEKPVAPKKKLQYNRYIKSEQKRREYIL